MPIPKAKLSALGSLVLASLPLNETSNAKKPVARQTLSIMRIQQAKSSALPTSFPFVINAKSASIPLIDSQQLRVNALKRRFLNSAVTTHVSEPFRNQKIHVSATNLHASGKCGAITSPVPTTVTEAAQLDASFADIFIDAPAPVFAPSGLVPATVPNPASAISTAVRAPRSKRCQNLPTEKQVSDIIDKSYSEVITRPEMLNQYEKMSSQTYGESNISLVSKLVAETKNMKEIFVDLGSGVGQVCMMVAALSRASKCFGIEFKPNPCTLYRVHEDLRY
jgi:hypothetical protein